MFKNFAFYICLNTIFFIVLTTVFYFISASLKECYGQPVKIFQIKTSSYTSIRNR